jgi:hypothetical protein
MNLSGRAVAFALLVVMQAVPGQWERTPYTQWTEKEALRVLDDSPWGQTQVFADEAGQGGGPARNGDPNRAIDQGGSRVSYATQINFRIRFLSALPVRQAISRLVELNHKGEMSAAFAARLRDFIAEESADRIVVSVLAAAPRPSIRLQKASEMLDSLTTEKLRGKVYLAMSNGRRARLEEYQPPGQDGLGARFIFPRNPDGKPLVSDQQGAIRFHAELSETYTLDRSYRLRDMIYQGKLEY